MQKDIEASKEMRKLKRIFKNIDENKQKIVAPLIESAAFITSLPAAEVMAAQGRALPDGPAADAGVLVQGIADIVLIYPDHLELLDYKTDRRKTPADFVRAYRAQLELYARAIDKRFAPRRVTYKGIYSLELGELIEV